MGAFFLFAFFSLCLLSFTQASYGTCEIEGTEDLGWDGFHFKEKIKDTFKGVVGVFQTRNVVRATVSDSNGYLDATWENQTLTIFTRENFENYEELTKYVSNPYIDITVDFDCTKDDDDYVDFTQEIEDVNNHAPVLNKENYKYIFGMTIPKSTALTDFFPIIARDVDITNNKVIFKIEENEFFSVDNEGQSIYPDYKNHTTNLRALQDIVAPFNKTFTLKVTDKGSPNITTTGTITVVVTTPEELTKLKEKPKEEEKNPPSTIHPPIFSQHIYYGRIEGPEQTFTMDEPVLLKTGGQSNTILKQNGHEKYFQVGFDGENYETIVIKKIGMLPEDIHKNEDFIVFEIEAVNEGLLHFPGRAAVIIYMPQNEKEIVEGETTTKQPSTTTETSNPMDCENPVIFGYSVNGYVIPMMLFLTSVIAIIFVNVYIMIMFFNKQKCNSLTP